MFEHFSVEDIRLEGNQPNLECPQFSVVARQTHQVVGVSSKGVTKKLRLSNGDNVNVHRFACVGNGDSIYRTSSGELFVITNDGDTVVLPLYSSAIEFEPVEGRRLILECQEIATRSNYDAYEALAQFHYRSQNSFGRRAILVLTTGDEEFPEALGFVEITTAFLSSKNRSTLFDAPFESDVGRHVAWERWDNKARLKYTNTVARISRMVVHPEVRGLGLSKVLVYEAENFCKQRWSLNGMRPLFLEITADMLKFMPFVHGARMHWIGNSPGNRQRIEKDMRYLESRRGSEGDHWINRRTSKGIASRQRKDIDRILELKEQFEREGKDIFVQLSRVIDGDGDVDSYTYELLSSLVRLPKPTFMKGLTNTADAFVKARCIALGLQYRREHAIDTVASCSSAIRVRDLSLSFDVDTGLLGSSKSGVVRRAFGLPRHFRFETGVKGLTFEVAPGEICFVHGSSGAGKTAMLNIIVSACDRSENRVVTGKVTVPGDGVVGVLESEWPDSALLNSIEAGSLVNAIEALNASGLAEPRLYLSRWQQLSAGQRYRAQLAKLICSDANIWILDEFASNLDDATAVAVGKSFARVARRRDAICIIASVRRRHLINAVSPDVVVQLNQIGRPVVSRNWKRLVGLTNGN